MARRSADQIMRDNAIPSLSEQQTLVRSLSRLLAGVERAEGRGVTAFCRTPEERAARLALHEKEKAKMRALTAYLTKWGRTWEQRQAEMAKRTCPGCGRASASPSSNLCGDALMGRKCQ
jgi:hypothetical protein